LDAAAEEAGPRACFNPSCIISRCNGVPERYYGSRARGTAGRHYADVVLVRIVSLCAA